MRTRSLVSSEPPVSTCLKQWGAGFDPNIPACIYWTNDLNNQTVPASQEKVFTDVLVPGFYRRRSRGEIFNNPMTSSCVTWKRVPMDWVYCALQGMPYNGTIHTTGGYKQEGTFPAELLLGTAFLPASLPEMKQRVQDLAITSAWAKAHETDVDALVMLAEGQETVRSFVSIAYRVIRTLRALRRWDVNWIKRQLTPKELADRWMEGRYVVRPTVCDIYGCVNALKRVRMTKPMRKTYRSGASDSSSASSADILVNEFPGNWKLYGNKQTLCTVTARSGILAAIEEISEATIWGLNQPLSTLWELIPYSFVVDWFFNVGKTLASWSPMFGARALASWVVVTSTTVATISTSRLENTALPVVCWYSNYCSATNGFVHKTEVVKERIADPSRPVLPTFNVRLNAAKLLDLVIIGKQLLRSH